MCGRARVVLLRVAGALAFVLGCGSGAPPYPPGFGSTPCVGPLDVVGADCPPSFDGTFANVACPAYLSQRVYGCKDTVMLLESGGFSAVWCAYDPTSHALVGAAVTTTDLPTFCNNRARSETAGKQLEAACVLGTPLTSRVCSSDGSAASPGDGSPDASSVDVSPVDASPPDAGADALDAAAGDDGARDGGDAAVSE